jgi:hypothetical protein
MFKRLLLSAMLMGVVFQNYSQSITFNYNGLYDGGSCQKLYPSKIINGVTHKAIAGYVTAPGVVPYNNVLNLDAWSTVTRNSSSAVSVEYPFLAGHYYKITFLAARKNSSANNPFLSVFLNDFDYPALDCGEYLNFGALGSAETERYKMKEITSTVFQEYVLTFDNLWGDFPRFWFAAMPKVPVTQNDLYQQVLVSSMKIEDVTLSTPIFTLTQNNQNTLKCGEILPKTFTINNINNFPGATYKFFLSTNLGDIGNGWNLTDGTPAPNSISGQSISLKSKQCAKGIYAIGMVTYNNVNYWTNYVFMSAITPELKIYGPSQLISAEAGLFDVQGVESTPLNYNWPCSFFDSWSITSGSGALYNTQSFKTNFYGTNTTSLSPLPVTITASVNMCGTTKKVTKNVNITKPVSFPFFNAKGMLANKDALQLNINPNPSSGIYTVTFSQLVSDALITVISIDGKNILKKKVTGAGVEIDLSAYPAGLYILRMDSNNEILTEKLVKN